MHSSTRHPVSLHPRSASTQAGRAYSDVGDSYLRYADGDPRRLYAFEGRNAYADRQVWRVLYRKMQALRASGARCIRILDAGCGPGTWLRRVVLRAHALGFRRISARGFDVAEGQIDLARRLASDQVDLEALGGIHLDLDVGDITRPFPERDASVDITLCLYAVLNHVDAEHLPAVMAELARVTSGHFVTTVRAAGGPPTIFVEGIEHARRFRQDHGAEIFDVELDDGRRMTFDSRLFTSSELRGLVGPHFDIERLHGLDLFHARFAPDPRWNPSWICDSRPLRDELARLEERYGSDPSFVDRAAHLLLVAKKRGA